MGITLDTALEAISDSQRRAVLFALRDRDDPVTVDGDDTDVEDVDGSTLLVHTHLPKLDEMGIIDWKRQCGEVTEGEHFTDVEPLLELLRDNEDQLPATST